MASFLDIETSLQTHLKTVPGIPAIVWPNQDAEFDANITYVSPQNIVVQPTPVGIGDDDTLRIDGFYQVDIYTPRDSGIGDAIKLADDIGAHFQKGSELITPEGKIRFKYNSIESGDSVGAHFHVILLIHYVTIVE